MNRSQCTILGLFLVLFVAPVYSQPQVYVLAPGSPSDQRLSSVIERAALLEIQNAGLKGIAGEASLPAEAPLSALIQTARTSGSSFLLLARYRRDNGQLVMELSFLQLDRGNQLGAVSAALPLDLDLDVRIYSTVRRLLEAKPVQEALVQVERAAEAAASGGEASSQTASRRNAGAEREPEAAGAAGAGASAAAPPKAASGGTVRPMPSGEGGARAATIEPSPGGGAAGSSPSAGAPGWGFALSGQVAPLLLVGGGSSYFRYGADLSLFAGARLPSRGIDLEAGVKIAATELFPVSGLLPGQAFLFLGGPELRVGSDVALPVSVSARASAGVAVVMAAVTGSAPLASTVAYVDGGLSAALRLFGRFRLGADLGYLAVFESEFPIMGFAPAIEVAGSW